MVNNPFAAAQYFHIVMNAITEHLMGVSIEKGRVKSKPGVLGLVRSYFGSVESQGRGNLHCHLLIWLANTPDNSEMADLLKTSEFRERLREYIRRTISADVIGLSEERAIAKKHAHPHPMFRRPPDPDDPHFATIALDYERSHVECSQFHDCGFAHPARSPCLVRHRYGQYTCKRRAPWPLSDDVVVDESGNYLVK